MTASTSKGEDVGTGDTAHTAGPWKAIKGGLAEGDDFRCGVTAVRGETEYLLATIENGAPGDICDTEWANAVLIAEAPNLLAALDKAVRAIEYMMPRFERDMFAAKIAATRSRALVVIAHAEGRTP